MDKWALNQDHEGTIINHLKSNQHTETSANRNSDYYIPARLIPNTIARLVASTDEWSDRKLNLGHLSFTKTPPMDTFKSYSN